MISPEIRRLPHVGAVVIGRNEGPRLAACLASLGDMTRVVYVDSASTDDSVALATGYGADVVSIPPGTTCTAALARNLGARRLLECHPGLKYIQFIDGDCELQPNWLLAAASFADDHPDVAVVCGRRFERYPQRSIYNAMCDKEWDTAIGRTESSGGDALVRRSAYLEVGGFADDQIAHEEPEFCVRLRAAGWWIWRIDQPMTRHDASMFHLRQFYRRSQRAGYGISQCLSRTNGPVDSGGRSIVRRSMFWAVVIPFMALITIVLDWRLSVAILCLYLAQAARLWWKAGRNGWGSVDALKVAALSIVGKFAEAHGVIRYWFDRTLNIGPKPILYR